MVKVYENSLSNLDYTNSEILTRNEEIQCKNNPTDKIIMITY